MSDLHGVFSALLTPFDTKDAIDVSATERLVEFQVRQSVAGLYVGGSSGEAMAQSLEEREDYLRLVAKLAAGRLDLIAHVGAVATNDVVRLSGVAADAGYAAISAVTPYYYPFSRDEVMAHYNHIADSSALPLIIYNFPAITAGFSLKELATLLAHDQIIGVKHTSMDLFMLESIRRHCPEALVYNGYDEMCLAGLVTGAQGAIGTTYNFMGDLFVEVSRLVDTEKIEQARRLQIMGNVVIEALHGVGVLPGSKVILDLMGVPVGAARKPFRSLSSADVKTLEAAIQPILDWRAAK